MKKADKWFSNYNDEQVILIEEPLTVKHKHIVGKLFQWADFLPSKGATISGEVGSTTTGEVDLKHKYIIVQSKGLYDVIWKERYTREKLKKRFKEKHFVKKCVLN